MTTGGKLQVPVGGELSGGDGPHSGFRKTSGVGFHVCIAASL